MVSVKPDRDPKEELSKLVAPETYKDIEHYLKPKFESRASGELDTELVGTLQSKLPREARKITVDGYGKWREVHGDTGGKDSPVQEGDERLSVSRASSRSCVSSRSGSRLSSRASSRHSRVPSQEKLPEEETDKVNTATRNGVLTSQELRDKHFIYNDLSMALRANLFPGAGAYGTWQSQSKATYTTKEVVAPGNRDAFYGMQTDALGKWAEANVYRERVMKNWEEYMMSKPKPGELSRVLAMMGAGGGGGGGPRIKDPPAAPPTKPKKAKPKPVKKAKPADDKPPETPPTEPQIPDRPPSVPPIPVDDDDDDFWGFYDKPFNKPR